VASTIAAGGVAVDYSTADCAIFVDRSWTPGENLQAEERLSAVGKARPIHVERLVSDHPLELRVQQVLDAKQARIAAAVRS
jgi:SNF2 family DNA or RNA helicase